MLQEGNVTWADLEALNTELKQYFIYQTTNTGTSLSGSIGATASDTITFGQESDFIATELLAAENATADLSSANYYLIELVPQDSGRAMQNTGIHKNIGFGTAQRPHIMPAPRIFWRNTTLTVTWTNRTANSHTLWVALGGFKIYYSREATYGTMRARR